MGRVITFKVQVRDNGDIELKLPEGAGQQRDAGTLASFTERLAKLLGKVKERHIGRTDPQGVHTHQDGSVHHRH